MTRVFEYVLALTALTVLTVPFEVDGFAPVPLHSAAATVNAGYVCRAALPLLRVVDRKQYARLRMNADSASGGAVVEEQKVKRSKARIETGYSNSDILGDAIQQAVREGAGKLPEGMAPHAAFLFINSLYCNDGLLGVTTVTKDGRETRAGNEKYARALSLLSRQFAQRGWMDIPVVGTSVGGNIVDDMDYEGQDAGVSVTLLYLPGSKVMPFRVPDDMTESWKQSDWALAGLEAEGLNSGKLPSWAVSGMSEKDDAVIFSFAHPETPFFTKKVLNGLDFAFPRAKKVGAISGQAMENHEAALFMLPSITGADLNRESGACYDTGVVGLAISGAIAADTVVAQGSRPIGPNYEVLETDFNGTVINRMRDVSSGSMSEGAPTTLFDLAGFAGMIDQADVVAAVNYMALGISVTPLEEDIDKHQYIVRPITDLQKDGPISLNDQVREGQVVRFHVRDRSNAEAELSSLRARWQLERASRAMDGKYPAGAFVFTDQARGQKLYGKGGVETSAFARDFPGISLGGGYVDGAIGQLPNFGDRNEEPLFKGASGTPKPVGLLLDQMEKGTYLHGVGSAYLMIYGDAEDE